MSNYYTQELGFVPIKGYEHEYSINKQGKILSLLTDQYVKTDTDTKGYLTVNLYKDGHRNIKRVHILVAQTFIPNPKELPVVNHIDGNKLNPDVTNLEWTTYSMNTIHAYAHELINKNTTKVLCGDGRVYGSVTEAAIDKNLSKAAISKALNGKSKTAGGFTWTKL